MDTDKKNKKYHSLYKLIKSVEVKGFGEVTPIVAKTRLRDDLGLSTEGMNNRLEDARYWNFFDVEKLSALTGCDPSEITNIILYDLKEQRANSEKG